MRRRGKGQPNKQSMTYRRFPKVGLVYDCAVEEGDVKVKMTLTFPGCGMGPYIAQQAEWRIAELEEVEDVEVEMVYDPPWSPDMISEDGKSQLGLD